jgi:hypothetical protein
MAALADRQKVIVKPKPGAMLSAQHGDDARVRFIEREMLAIPTKHKRAVVALAHHDQTFRPRRNRDVTA